MAKLTIERVKLSDIKPNTKNPRIIKNDKFKKLVASLKDFPQMMELRPVVVDADGVILGGNMRYAACKELGWTEVPIIRANTLTDDQKNEFIIKDNASFGEWDWDTLANEWDENLLDDWGIEVYKQPPPIDYGILAEEDTSATQAAMTSGAKKAIQIEFRPDDYDDAYALVTFWRERGAYVGGMILDHLADLRRKL